MRIGSVLPHKASFPKKKDQPAGKLWIAMRRTMYSISGLLIGVPLSYRIGQ
jgi:hypothetical protein